MPSTRALIRAPWSASKISTALRCPRLYHFKYVDKVREPEVMPEARIGKAIHAALEDALGGTSVAEAAARARADLPDAHEQARYDQLTANIAPFIERIARFRRRRRVVRQLVEFSLAVREDFTTTSFYSGDAFYRGILDVGYVFDDDSIALVDHKTGVRIPGTSIADQLEGYVVLTHAWLRSASRFWLGLHWVAERAVEWGPPVGSDEVMGRMRPGLLDNIEAAALAVDDGPRTNPGSWCERCSYRTLCPASREQRYEPVEYEEDDEADD
ncbi:MAG: PD-(D/E)XK nuclease family protein [Deltaproteobacteria bacterium]|nr:PD-(D/E)XK nuclease family protein [Deltaproteobacteria bacterium]